MLQRNMLASLVESISQTLSRCYAILDNIDNQQLLEEDQNEDENNNQDRGEGENDEDEDEGFEEQEDL